MYAGDELYGDEVTSGLHWLDWDDHLTDRERHYDADDDLGTDASAVRVSAEVVTIGQRVRNPFTGAVFTVTDIEGLVTIDPHHRALLLRGGELGVTLFLGEMIEVLS